ncbi:MAG TPA: serine/threonine-protein kinase [Kofleriaceae bacterium]
MSDDESKRTRIGVGEKKQKQLPPLVGKTVLDRYRVEAVLGAGAMGSVFRGRDLKLDRDVAIKALHPIFSNDPTMLARFHREAQAAARLQHPNLISVLDVGVADDMQVMVLEFAKGPRLSDLINKKPMAPERIIMLVRQLLAGLAHAHAAGLIHRDLKPANVMVEIADDGTEIPRIVDFGIAILRDGDESTPGGRLTETGQILGTPLYMAPEQAKGETIDHRIDLFALGIVVYEMLCGETPFMGSAIEIALANISKDPPPIVKRVPGVTPDPLLERYARKLMARNLANRFTDATEAMRVLDLCVDDPGMANLELGVTDVHRASSLVSLPLPKVPK